MPNDSIHLLLQSPIADEIVTLVDQIITVQGQISEQFPQIFENIVKDNLAKNITSSLNNIYQTQEFGITKFEGNRGFGNQNYLLQNFI